MNNDHVSNSKKITSSRIVSERGQTVIPKPIRDYLDLQAGDRVEWTVNEQGTVFVHPVKRKSIMDFKGVVKTQYAVDNFEDALRQSKEDYYERKSETGGGE